MRSSHGPKPEITNDEILKVLICGHSLWWLQPQGERMSIFKMKNKGGTISYGYDFRDRVTGTRYRKIVPLARTKWDAEQAEIAAKKELFEKRFGTEEKGTTLLSDFLDE